MIKSSIQTVINTTLIFVLGMCSTISIAGSINKDPDTGNYIVIYEGHDSDGQPAVHTVTFVPATKIEPLVKSDYSINKEDQIVYSYVIRNTTKAKQSISGFHVVGKNVNKEVMTTPFGWFPISAKVSSSKYTVGWVATADDLEAGIIPGKTEKGFGFSVNYLPGVVNIILNGRTPVLAFPDEGPQGEIGKQLAKLENTNFVNVPVAAPIISTQFSNSLIIEKLNNHLNDLNAQGFLSQELKGSLLSLLDVAKKGIDFDDVRSAKTALKDALLLLKKELTGLDNSGWSTNIKAPTSGKQPEILKLAVQVLIFDINFILTKL